jgi:hypothetical protein
LALASVVMLTACGAPLKESGDVPEIFEGDDRSLPAKLASLCALLGERVAAPRLADLTLKTDGCPDAGATALNLTEISRFAFTGLGDGEDGQADEDEVVHREVRTQVWLNRSLIGLASAVSAKMLTSQGAGAGALAFGGGGTGGLSGLVTPKIELLEPPAMDLETLTFSTKIHLTLTGIIATDNVILVDGALIDNKLAVTIRTESDQPSRTMLINSFQTLLLIVPHAGDVYLDVFIDVKVNNPGLGKLLSSQLETFLGSGLKAVVDGLFTL